MKIKINNNILIKLLIFILVIIINLPFIYLFNSNSLSSTYEEQFQIALNRIENNDFPEAIYLLEKLWQQNGKTISVAKNLIFLYSSTGQQAKLYSFIRKSSIDLGYNKKYNEFLKNILPDDKKWLTKISVIDYINNQLLFIFFTISNICFLFLFSLSFFDKKINVKTMLILIIILNSFVFVLYFVKFSFVLHKNEALIFENTDIYEFPLSDSKIYFTTKIFSKATILENLDNYLLISLPNGKKGCVKSELVLKIF